MKKFDEIICICTGKKCKKKGGREIYIKFRKSLKGKRNEWKGQVIKTRCLDHCDSGPIVIKDNILFEYFSPGRIE